MRKTVLFLLAALCVPLAGFAQHTPPPLPTFRFNLTQVKFGAQSIGVQSCIYVNITNTTAIPQTIKKLYVHDGKNYEMPSPSQQMLPVLVQPNGNLTISVCFNPTTVGDHNTYIVLMTEKDSLALSIQGKGLKVEDISKLPKNDVIIEKPTKKSKLWNFKVTLLSQSKLTLQLFDALGTAVQSYAVNDLKPEGVIEYPFDEKDKSGKKFEDGNYYLRAIIDPIGRNAPIKFTKTVKIGK